MLRHLIFNSVFQQYVNRLSSISPSFHLPLLANQNNVDELLHSVTLHRQVSHLLISELAIGLRFLYLSVSFGIRICVLWSYFSFDIWQPCSMCVAQLLTCTWISSTESPLNLARALFPQICLNWPSVCALYNHQLRLSATSIAKQTLGKCWNGDCIANHRVLFVCAYRWYGVGKIDDRTRVNFESENGTVLVDNGWAQLFHNAYNLYYMISTGPDRLAVISLAISTRSS